MVFFWHFGSELLMSWAQLFQLSNSVEIETTLAALWQIGCSIVVQMFLFEYFWVLLRKMVI